MKLVKVIYEIEVRIEIMQDGSNACKTSKFFFDSYRELTGRGTRLGVLVASGVPPSYEAGDPHCDVQIRHQTFFDAVEESRLSSYLAAYQLK